MARIRNPSGPPTWIAALGLAALACARQGSDGPAVETRVRAPAESGDMDRASAELRGQDAGASLPARYARGARATAARLTLVRFWTDTCPYCERSLPALEDLRTRHAERGLDVIAIYHPKPPRAVSDAEVVAAAERLGYHGTIAVDEDWRALRAIWLDSGPRAATSASFLLDGQGRVRVVHPGPEFFPSTDPAHAQAARDFERLDRAIRELAAETSAVPAPSGAGSPRSRVDVASLWAASADRAALARLPDPLFVFRERTITARESAPGNSPASTAANWLEIEGPGVLVRAECTARTSRWRVYVDDAPDPCVAVDSVESLPMPIPFARRLRITSESAGTEGDARFGYRAFARGVEVESFRAGDAARTSLAEQARAAFGLPWSAPTDPVSFTYSLSAATPEGDLLCAHAETCRGPRAISAIEMRVEAPDIPAAIAALRVRLSFDGTETVSCPFDVLFAPGALVFQSSSAPGDFATRFVMPYAERFTFAIDNHGSRRDVHVSGQIRTRPFAWDERAMHLHAAFRDAGDPQAGPRPGPSGPRASLTVTGQGLLLWAAGGAGLEPLARIDGEASFAHAHCGNSFSPFCTQPFERRLVLEFSSNAAHSEPSSFVAWYYARPGATDDTRR